MSARSDRLSRLIGRIENPLSVYTNDALLASLESHQETLESLKVYADEMGTYLATGNGESEEILTPELKEKYIRAVKEADGFSEGRRDIDNAKTPNAVTWESIGLEANDNRGLLRKIIDAVVKFSRYIWGLIMEMIGEQRIESAKHALHSIRLDNITSEEFEMPASVSSMFLHNSRVDHVRMLFDDTHDAFVQISTQYLPAVGHTHVTLSNDLEAAFSSNFKAPAESLAVLLAFVKSHDAAARLNLPHRVGGIKNEGNTRYSGQLLDGNRLAVTTNDISLTDSDSYESKLNKLLGESVQLRRDPVDMSGSTNTRVTPWSVGELEQLIASAIHGLELIGKHRHALEELHHNEERTLAVIEKCARAGDVVGTKESIDMLQHISLTMTRRAKEPIVALQKLMVRAAGATKSFCMAHVAQTASA